MINRKIIFYYVIFSWIGLWASLGSNPYDFLFIFEKEKNILLNFNNMDFTKIINFIRSIFIPISLLISLVILIQFREKKVDKLIFILFFIQISQIFSTFLSGQTRISELENTIDHIGRYYWIICSLSLLAVYQISCKIGEDSNKVIFKISIIFLILITFFFSYKILADFIFLPSENSVYHLSVFRENAFFLSHDIPRVTGLSRTIIFLYLFTIFYKSNFEVYNKYIKYPFLVILGSLIILYQSKFGIISFILINIIFFFISKNKLKSIKFIFILLIFQFLLIFSLLGIKLLYNKYVTDYYQIQKIEKYVLDKKIIERIPEANEDQTTVNEYNFLRKYNLDRKKFPLKEYLDKIILSGRIKLWQEAIEFSLERPFFGYGSMSDRIFLNEKKVYNKRFVEPVSNAYIYAFLSGGLPSLFLILYFWKTLLYRNILSFQIKTAFTNENKIGYMLILFILLRTLIENSVMIFGIDLILLIHAITIIKNK